MKETELYKVLRTPIKPKVDGSLTHTIWQQAPRSPRFIDMTSGDPAILATTAAALWDDEALYVGFWIEDPYPSAKLTQRDSLIFQENDIEVFIDTGDAYYEFELNALNTVYEVLFIWQDAYEKLDPSQFDLKEAIAFGGNFDRTETHFWRGTHPRGLRWAFPSYDLPGLSSAVSIDGKLNDPTVVSRGWRAEIAFPWKGMKAWSKGTTLPPKAGDEWRIFFGRFQKLQLAGKSVSAAWSWDKIGSADNHLPERFTRVQFSDQAVT